MSVDYGSYEDKFLAWQKAKFSPPPEKPCKPAEPSSTYMLEMRDGIKLYTELYLPAKPGRYPTILVRSPYPFGLPSRHDARPISRYLVAGYAFVFQMTRGQGKSEGCFRFFKDDIKDGFDCIEWISTQSWSNGNVGMEGSSYLGGTQLMAAKARPRALKCIMPTAFIGDFTRSFPFAHGVPMKGHYLQWHQVLDAESWDDMDVEYCDMSALDHPVWGPALRQKPLIAAADNVLTGDKLINWRETIDKPMNNEFWRDLHFSDADLLALDIPIFFTDGWYDMTIGPAEMFERLEKLQPNRKDRYLLIGPWDHYQTAASSERGENNGDRILPDGAEINHVDHKLAFFDHYLKGEKSSKIQEERVRVFITGASSSSANYWLNLPTFPPQNITYKKMYLHSDGDARSFPGNGILDLNLPGNEPIDTYVYDPSLPTSSLVESSKDRREIEVRSDVLTYTSQPFPKDVILLGNLTLILYAASDATDTDWFALVTEVCPKGKSRSFHYAPPAFRARYHDGLHKESFLTPGKVEMFRIPLGPVGHQISAGYSLRLSIFSSAFPEYEPNTNTGSEAATDTEFKIANQSIVHDCFKPSHLILPVYCG